MGPQDRLHKAVEIPSVEKGTFQQYKNPVYMDFSPWDFCRKKNEPNLPNLTETNIFFTANCPTAKNPITYTHTHAAIKARPVRDG